MLGSVGGSDQGTQSGKKVHILHRERGRIPHDIGASSYIMVAIILFEADDKAFPLKSAEDGPDAEVLGKAVFSIERKVGRSHPEKIAFSIDIDESHLILYGPVRFVGRGCLCLCQFEHRKQHKEGKETFWHAHLRVIRFNSAKMQRTEEKVMSGFYQNLSRKIILFRDYTHPSF